jgi:hypothetical protein
VPKGEVLAALGGIEAIAETVGPANEMLANMRLAGGRVCQSDAHVPDPEGWLRALEERS